MGKREELFDDDAYDLVEEPMPKNKSTKAVITYKDETGEVVIAMCPYRNDEDPMQLISANFRDGFVLALDGSIPMFIPVHRIVTVKLETVKR